MSAMWKRSDLDKEQLKCIQFMDSGEDSLSCADVGTGKTVMTLEAAKKAVEDGRVTRWLIVAPLLVATETWANEHRQWEQLQFLDVQLACGDERQRMAAIESSAAFVVINYENLTWLLERYPRKRVRNEMRDSLPFDGIIFDEIDKLKSISTNRFKSLRNRITSFRKRIGLTGTVLPTDLTDLWGQVYLVDNGLTFGRSFTEWRKKYFYPTDYNQFKWVPFEKTEQLLVEALEGLAFRLESKHLPNVEFVPPTALTLPSDVRKLYAELDKNFIVKMAEGARVDAPNAAVLSGKLQQISAGFSYVDSAKGERLAPVWHTYLKLEWLSHLADTLAGRNQQLLIVYCFKAELIQLRKMWTDFAYLGSNVTPRKAAEAIERWHNKEVMQLGIHPLSAGHGINLQKSGAHHIAFLTPLWPGGLVKQVVGRLARRGQVSDTIYVHMPYFKDTIDEKVIHTFNTRLDTMERFLDGVKKIS